MNTGRFSWVDPDARLIIAARAVRGFAQSAVSVLVAGYLAVQGFSLVETGLLLTCGSIGASVSAVVVGLFGDALGRRRAALLKIAYDPALWRPFGGVKLPEETALHGKGFARRASHD